MRLSRRAAGAAESATLRLSAELARRRRAGADIVNLLEGEADLPVPEKVKAAASRALAAGRTRYCPSSGLPELRAAIAAKLRHDNGVRASADGVLVTNGAKQAIYTALQTLCDPGDEVIVPSPYWVTFPEAVRLAGAKPVFVPAPGHDLDVDALGRALTSRTKAIILNTPNNPTGAVYSAVVLKDVAELARRRDLFIVADEAYEALVYDGREHVSVASISADAARRTVTVQTFSKTYSMTGLRVGYLAGEPDFVRAAARLHGHMTGNVCTVVQHAAAAALRLGPAYRARLRAVFERRRDLAYAAAGRVFDCLKPRGGFSVFADARRHLGGRFKDSAALSDHLLRRAHVAVVPGSACGMEGRLRISFSHSEKDIKEGFRRIEAAL
ncbi:MAG: pyridoxal phosphate-dependent aminotransferase [Elusimicrobia bacterium]|nr:pyridoxal phosphate-dependent aminotransferase [Elusimicrobiota bacterium]